MPKAKSPKRDKAFKLYKENHGNIALVKIADKLKVSSGTIRSWKYNDKWEDKLKCTFQKDINAVKRKKNNLNDKQKLFCLHYIQSFNATRAYEKAYECSYNTAKTNGHKLLTNAYIKAEIDSLIAESLEEQEIKSKYLCNAILQKYIDIAFSDISDFVVFGTREIIAIDDNGNTKTKKINYVDFKDSKEVDSTLIAEIKTGKSGSSIKLQDKMKALEFLSKYLGIMDFETKEKLQLLKNKMELDREKFDYTKNKVKEFEEENDGLLKDMLEGFNNMLK